MNLVNKAKISKISKSSANYSHHTTISGEYTEGTVSTPFGFVRVYAESKFWAIEFIWSSKSYYLGCRCEQLPSDKALTRRAAKFAKEVVQRSFDNCL